MNVNSRQNVVPVRSLYDKRRDTSNGTDPEPLILPSSLSDNHWCVLQHNSVSLEQDLAPHDTSRGNLKVKVHSSTLK